MKFLLLCSLLGFVASQTTPDPTEACGPAIPSCYYGTFEFDGQCYPEPGKTCMEPAPEGYCALCGEDGSCTPTSHCVYFGGEQAKCYPNTLGGSCFVAETPAPSTPECGPCGPGNICPPASWCYEGSCYATFPSLGCIF